MLISCGPHQTNIGKRLLRQISTATRSSSGQFSGAPRGVRAQSNSRTRCAISPAVGFIEVEVVPAKLPVLTRLVYRQQAERGTCAIGETKPKLQARCPCTASIPSTILDWSHTGSLR